MALEKKIAAAFLVAITITLLIGIVSYRNINLFIETNQEVERSYRILAQLEKVFSMIKGAESSVRGYVLTGDEQFLQSYSQSDQIVDQAAELQQWMRTPEQRKNISDLIPLIRKRLDIFQEVVEARATKGFAQANDLVATGDGQETTDLISKKIEHMEIEENRLLKLRAEKQMIASERSVFTILIGSVLAVVVVVLAGVFIYKDLSDRRHVEEEAHESRLFLDSVLENIPNMVFVKDPRDLKFLRFNKAGEELLGISKTEMIGKSDYDFFPKEQADFFVEKDREVLQKGKLIEISQEPLQTKHGQRILHTKKVPVLDSSGSPEYLLGISEDITDRVNAEKERDRFFTLSLDLLCIAGFDGYFKRLNPAWEKVLGFPLQELLSRPYVEFIHPEDRSKTDSEADHLTDGLPTLSFENRYLCKDGTYKWLLWNAVPNSEDQLIYAIARDITERKHFEDEIQNLNVELEKRLKQVTVLNEELESFSYSVSHDLRAPLRHIHGFADLLNRNNANQLDAKGKRHLEIISDSARRMGQLIDDLLAFSRMGRMELRKGEVNLEGIIDRIRRDNEAENGNREIEWKISSLPRVRADVPMITQVLTNLISNALKYTSKRDYVLIEIGCQENPQNPNEVVFFVRDNGVGFDMKYSDKLFGVFQRLHSSDQFEGTGIGLANVRRIVQRHGGRVWAESEIDHGATFYFSIVQEASNDGRV